MQYIKKQNTEPVDWSRWLAQRATGTRVFDYRKYYSEFVNSKKAREFLIQEQHGLCAYCQKEINLSNSSIEHVIAKAHNIENSTNYFNLVAVCREKKEQEHQHCDVPRGNSLIPPVIFYANSMTDHEKINYFFESCLDGTIIPKETLKTSDPHVYSQIKSFLEILNLNEENLKENRKKVLSPIYTKALKLKGVHRKIFFQNNFDRIFCDTSQPYREFLLIYIKSKLSN